MMGELPKGWTSAKLAEITTKVGSGATPRGGSASYQVSGIPLIRSMNVKFEGFDPGGLAYLNERQANALKEVTVRSGDVLLNITGASIGRVAQAPRGMDGARVNQHVCIIRTVAGFDATFLAHYLSSPSVQTMIWTEQYGVTRQALTKGQILDFDIPVPPPVEIERMNKKLDELLRSAASCQQRLNKIPLLLDRFRQSVLAAACSGRLTADWRDSRNGAQGIEFVIRQIRERRLKVSSSIRQRQVIEDMYSAVEENDSDALPQGWAFTYLNKLAESFDYGTSSKSAKKGKVPVLRMGNIQGGRIDWDDLVYTSDAEEMEKYALEPGTVLFNRTNSPELVGKTAIYRGERPAIFAGYLIRINTVPELDPEYLNLCLNNPSAREFCLRVKTDGVSQSNINAQKLGTFEIPFCSLAEQREIVRRTAKLFALADGIESRYEAAKKCIDGLSQSTLAKAFRGELVPTEAELAKAEGRSFESAEELLHKIRQREMATKQDESQRSPGRGRKRSPRPVQSTGRTKPIK